MKSGKPQKKCLPELEKAHEEDADSLSATAFTWGNTTLSNAIGVAGQSLLSGQYEAQEVIDQLVFELGW